MGASYTNDIHNVARFIRAATFKGLRVVPIQTE